MWKDDNVSPGGKWVGTDNCLIVRSRDIWIGTYSAFTNDRERGRDTLGVASSALTNENILFRQVVLRCFRGTARCLNDDLFKTKNKKTRCSARHDLNSGCRIIVIFLRSKSRNDIGRSNFKRSTRIYFGEHVYKREERGSNLVVVHLER